MHYTACLWTELKLHLVLKMNLFSPFINFFRKTYVYEKKNQK